MNGWSPPYLSIYSKITYWVSLLYKWYQGVNEERHAPRSRLSELLERKVIALDCDPWAWCHLCCRPCELGGSYSEPTSWLTLSKTDVGSCRCHPFQIPEPVFSRCCRKRKTLCPQKGLERRRIPLLATLTSAACHSFEKYPHSVLYVKHKVKGTVLGIITEHFLCQ